jgi:molybdopterin-guanine dinucleotide biosynthesis protein MobB
MRVFGVVGHCSAKAGVVRRLVTELRGRGLRVSTLKRVNDDVDLDRPGSGTWGHREAGAEEVMLASGARFALLREHRSTEDEPDVDDLLARMTPVDVVLLEGFRLSAYPKLEAVRPDQDRRLLALDDPSVVAVTGESAPSSPVPFIALAEIGTLADLVLAHAAEAGSCRGDDVANEPANQDFAADGPVMRAAIGLSRCGERIALRG